MYAFNASGDLLITSYTSLAAFPEPIPFLKVVSNISSSAIFKTLPTSIFVNLDIISLFKSSLLVITKSLNFCNSSRYSFPAFFLTWSVKAFFKNFNLPTSTLSPAAKPISFSLINLPKVDIVSLALAKGIKLSGLARSSKKSFLKIPSTLATFIKFFVSLSESLLIAFAISSVFIVLKPVTLSNSAAASFASLLYALLKSPTIDLNSTPVTPLNYRLVI